MDKKNLTLGIGLGVVLAMLILSFASVPLYNLFCRITGFDGTTQRVAVIPASRPATNRSFTVSFNADVQKNLPWKFMAPNPITVKVGEPAQTTFHVTNTSEKLITGTSVYNVTPEKMGIYFNKVQCFCFERQTLQPGETKEFPVLFFIDEALLDDRNLDGLGQMTLSYTFFEAPREK